jgi:hypothetical protein
MQSLQLPAGVLAIVMHAIHTRRREATNLTRNTTITEVDATYEVGFDESHTNLVVLCSPDQTHRDRLEAELNRLNDELPSHRTSANLRVEDNDPNAEQLRKRRVAARDRSSQIEVRILEISAALEQSPDSRRLIIPVRDLAKFGKFHVEPVEGIAEAAEWVEGENAGMRGLISKAVEERNAFEERVTLLEIDQAELKGKLKRAALPIEVVAKAVYIAEWSIHNATKPEEEAPTPDWDGVPEEVRAERVLWVRRYLDDPGTEPITSQFIFDDAFRDIVDSFAPFLATADEEEETAEKAEDEEDNGPPATPRVNTGSNQGVAREIAKSVRDKKKNDAKGGGK